MLQKKSGKDDRANREEARDTLIKLCGKKKINATNRYITTTQRKLQLCADSGQNAANVVARSSTTISAQLKVRLYNIMPKRFDECNINTYSCVDGNIMAGWRAVRHFK